MCPSASQCGQQSPVWRCEHWPLCHSPCFVRILRDSLSGICFWFDYDKTETDVVVNRPCCARHQQLRRLQHFHGQTKQQKENVKWGVTRLINTLIEIGGRHYFPSRILSKKEENAVSKKKKKDTWMPQSPVALSNAAYNLAQLEYM